MNKATKLCHWYLKNKRDLPWRKTKDPYSIWLSEVMLQQTTVKAVIPYFENFLKHFPKVHDLAKAKEDLILALWSGLGYYSRARNLHQAAQQVVKLGAFPNRYEDLLQLKGIGPYTAAAIASIAFEEEIPVVDGNVMRVATRLMDISEDIRSSGTQKEIFSHVSEMIKNQKPSVFNQAMMELGATVCTPKNPTCLICPLIKDCLAYKNGTVLERPVKKKLKKQEIWQWTLLLVKNKNKWAMVNTDNGTPWLKNMWVFPGQAKPLQKKPKAGWTFKHSITHHNIFVKIKLGEKKDLPHKKIKWFSINEIENLGVSSIVKKVINIQKL